MYGFHNRALADLPAWSGNLNNYYFRVRLERRNKSLLRKQYRLIRAEKLRLIEAGICPHQINAVCKYLVSLKQVNADRLQVVFDAEVKQLSFDFYHKTI